MEEILKKDSKMEQAKTKIKNQVLRFKALGLSEEEIVCWIENKLHPRINLTCIFGNIEEMAEITELPVFLFGMDWDSANPKH